jgi:hypothetical protein
MNTRSRLTYLKEIHGCGAVDENRKPGIVDVRAKLGMNPRCVAYQSGMDGYGRSGLTHVGGDISRHPDAIIRHWEFDTDNVLCASVAQFRC